MTPEISVIMSVYNNESCLEESIDSILNQTFKNFEFIIINDNSTDNSLRIIKRYKDKRIIVLNNPKNIGLTKSLNKGLKIAKGKYIARMDADDISLPERFKIQHDYLEKNQDIFLVATSFFYINEEGKIIDSRRRDYNWKEVEINLPKQNLIHHPTVLFRNNHKIYYRDKFVYSQDYDLWLRLLSESKKMKILPNFLIKYRISSKSISLSRKKDQKYLIKMARKFYLERKKYREDSYNRFSRIKRTKKNEKIDNSTAISKEIILNLKNSRDMSKIRNQIHLFWSKNGNFRWPEGFIIYGLTFIPYKIRKKIIKRLWR